MSKKFSTLIVTFFTLVFLFVMLMYQDVRSNVRQATPTPPYGQVPTGPAPISDEIPEGLNPTPSRRTDLAPNALEEEKIPVIVRHLDGTYELLLFPPGSSYTTIKGHFLPTDVILGVGPAPSMMGHYAPTFAPNESNGSGSGRPVPPTIAAQDLPILTPPAPPIPAK